VQAGATADDELPPDAAAQDVHISPLMREIFDVALRGYIYAAIVHSVSRSEGLDDVVVRLLLGAVMPMPTSVATFSSLARTLEVQFSFHLRPAAAG